MFDYVKKYNGFVDRLLHHLNTSAMMDLLLQMVVAPDTNQIRLDLAEVHICNVFVMICMYILKHALCHNASLYDSGLMIKKW